MVPMTGGSSTAVKILGTALAGAMGDTTDQIISNGKVDVVRTIKSGLMSAATAAAGAVISKAVSSTAGRTLYNSKGDASPGQAQEQSKPKVTDYSGKAKNKLLPDLNAVGDHTSFKRNGSGTITNYRTWQSNPRNPNGFDLVKGYDGVGNSHYNKVTGVNVYPPHIHDKAIPGGVRPAEPWEIPTNRLF